MKIMRATRALSALVFFVVSDVVNCFSIKDASKARQKPIERVAIVGAGIAGLSLAHALKNSPSLSGGSRDILKVSIFDSRKKLDYTVGSGIQLNGGMAVLGKINPNVQKAVIDAAVPIGELRGRYKSWRDEGKIDKLWDFSIREIVQRAGGETSEELIQGDALMWFGIMRGALQEVLMENLPKDDSISTKFNKTLIGIRSGGDGAVCEFSDGSVSGPFDIVVGCDGIKSAVKEYIEKGRISEEASYREGNAAALYSGIRVGFAVTDGDASDKNRESRFVEQIFADGAYFFSGTFGNGFDRPHCKCSFITSLDDRYNGPFKRKDASQATATAENADWIQQKAKSKDESRRRMVQQLKEFNIPGKDISSIIENADRFFELGIYFHNPVSFVGWSKVIPSTDGSVAVLCGDAAHAMPPFLGQGGNQAIQDSYFLAKKIHQYNHAVLGDTVGDEKLCLLTLLREYERIRWKPTASITAKAAILGYLETGGRSGFYSKFRDVFFTLLTFFGVPARVLTDAATPKV